MRPLRLGAFAIKRHRRGTAEIELILVIPVFLTLLFMVRGVLYLGETRLQNVYNTQQNAYTDAIRGAPPLYTDNGVQPLEGFATVRPGLPYRVHLREQPLATNFPRQVPLRDITITDTAMFIAPAWTYSAFPVRDSGSFNDQTNTQDWYSTYAGEVRSALEEPLGLSPATPP